MAMQSIVSALAKFVAAAMVIGMNTAHAAEIKVLASVAVKEAYLDLVPQFEKASGHKVSVVWSATPDIVKRVTAGEIYDLVILAGLSLDELIKSGKVVSGSRVDLAKSGIGIAVKSGAPKPDISSAEAVKKAALAAKTIGLSGAGVSGTYIVEMFQKMGIADEVKAKLVVVKPGEPVGAAVARGDVELGFHQVSELLPVKGIDYLGPLPADIQHITVFSAGLHTAATAPDAAKALVKFLISPEAGPIIRKTGMEPG